MIKFLNIKSKEKAWEKCPWAYVIVRLELGCLAFSTKEEYEHWKEHNG